MTLFSQADLEARTGAGASDFLQAGEEMTADQWAAYVVALEKEVSQAIARFTRRTAIEETEYTEFHDGGGPTGERRQYVERDVIILPWEQPVQSITSVDVDEATLSGARNWVPRTPRDETTGGDYEVLTRNGITRIRFHTRVPRKGHGNVRIVYRAGYAATSRELEDLRGIALEMAGKTLEIKKRRQEAQAARRVGTRDAADMVPIGDPKVLSDDIRTRLLPYRRERAGRRAWR